MISHDLLDDAARDRAVLFALGAMPGIEASAYEAHLSVCHPCAQEVLALREIASGLAELAPAVRPPDGLKARLFERLRSEAETRHGNPAARREDASAGRGEAPVQVWKRWADDPHGAGMVFIPAGAGGWELTGVDGVDVRRLFVDAANDRATMLVRMAPGSSYPSHRHGGIEECLVLEGDILVGEHLMRTGDYQRASGGSVHGVQSTREGCLLLIVSSLRDELLDHAAG